MIGTQKIDKLGTSSSEIYHSKDKFIKKYIFNNDDEIKSLIEGTNLLSAHLPESIEKPITVKKNIPSSNKIEFYYEQKSLNPWIKPEWITGLQLFYIGSTILKQQKLLIKNGFCFVDARPSNYWLAKTNGRLVDLASIKPLVRQNLLSFLADFTNHFINPLRLENELNIPASLYFEGNLQTCEINNWGLTGTIKSLSSIKKEIKQSFANLLSNIISSSSPDFIEFLNDDLKNSDNKSISLKKSEKLLKNLEKQFNLTKPNLIKKSNWINYLNFHQNDYNKKKIVEIKDYLIRKSPITNVIDIGSNLTTSKLELIYAKVDNDMSICREMRKISKDNEIVLQLNVAKYLCNLDRYSDNPLNCLEICKSAIFTGIIHHLIIDYGLQINNFYQNTSLLFDNILLEFPTIDDPMVSLLINKKNEKIEWGWENNHKKICDKYFTVVKKTELSKTRFLYELVKK